MKSTALVVFTAFCLVACGSIPDAGKVLIGTAQLSQSSSVRDTLLDYLPSESEERINRDLVYLENLYEQMQGLEPDASVLSLALESPDAFERIGQAFAAIRGEVLAYHRATGIPVPVDLVAYSAGTEPAYAEIRDAIASSDRSMEIIEIVRLLRPLVAVLL